MSAEAIIFKVYQTRQLEIHRGKAKNKNLKENITKQIHALKAELDPLLTAYVEEKKKQPQMHVPKDNKDTGPVDVVAAIHAYIQMKCVQQEVIDFLERNEPISIAGQFGKNSYIYMFHIEKNAKTN